MSLQGQKQLRELVAGLAEARGKARSTPIEPTFAQRYECKFLVDASLAGEIRAFVAPFVRPDGFAARRPAHRYPVGSLYLDSRDLLLYRQTLAGEKDRFKLRVRTYSDEPGEPAYFEVKRKVNSVVHKRRAGLPRELARAVLAGRTGEGLAGLTGRRLRDMDYFLLHASQIDARPVVRVKYWREAYEATGNEPVRITIDTELVHAMSSDGELGHGGNGWAATALEGSILEIKFTERFPWWLQDFVTRFGLKQQSVPKYVLSIEHMLKNGRRSALASAGIEPPMTWS